MSGSVDARGPLWARSYVRLARKADQRGGADHRRRLLEGLTGRVAEIGAGQGVNFAHYPQSVSEVVAVEPLAYLRTLAEQAAQRAPVRVTVLEGTAGALPFDDSSFDAAVVSLVLCSVPDQQRALKEIGRVLRPGGELRFYEHVVARNAVAAALMRFADATFWPRVAGGCHCARDTASAIGEAGFGIERLQRFIFRGATLEPPIPHILGCARAS